MSSRRVKRAYTSKVRDDAAAQTRERVLAAAKRLFATHGLDAVTISELAARARVSSSTVYALFKSKEGVFSALMEAAMFGARYRAASAHLDDLPDPVEQIAATPAVSRAIYESEASELALMRGASGFSPALRKIEQRFEELRYSLQRARVERLYQAGRAKKGLGVEKARRLLWMYTSRDVYRLLVQEGGWSADEYQAWLSQTLLDALVERGSPRSS